MMRTKTVYVVMTPKKHAQLLAGKTKKHANCFCHAHHHASPSGNESTWFLFTSIYDLADSMSNAKTKLDFQDVERKTR